MVELDGLSVKELDALVKAAQKRKALLKKRTPIAQVRAQLAKQAQSAGYTIEELFGAHARRGKAAKKGARRKRVVVAPKYRNPANPEETWTGRGRQPRWLAALTGKGKKLESFLIKS